MRGGIRLAEIKSNALLQEIDDDGEEDCATNSMSLESIEALLYDNDASKKIDNDVFD